MKLSFTTLGCPKWELETIVSRAAEYGFDGIDFRGLLGHMNVYELEPFATSYAQTRDRIADAGLEVTCFSSSITLVSKEREEQNLEELKRYAELCERFGTRYIRAFGGKLGGKERAEGIAVAASLLSRADAVLRGTGVKLIIETHDDWTRCEDTLLLLEGTSPETVGVLWDVHHPYRMFGERPERTWDVLGPRIEYTHWKDSLPNDGAQGTFTYRFMGEGDVPLRDMYAVLQANRYDGWYTFEWEKHWHPAIEEPEEAFPRFVRYMRELGATSAR
ncbi:sugar phosphate isomerase/epimerase family protein [Paenibacillus ginsengarvi]|uniref:Sugar phosphate isomerase/epimerase n=1 Tax=Paenibacillus ginsengarvi TaxID=400777 RepID=A0A3B0CAQ9_9BACL|nr:sugar phosphate isomerase/epimerase family protein [Paenibacillus ginsengarvi]RKN80707.1 sugar phosphate isomerase/epimerase [Paenibacillus ginsengarvi]